MKKPILSVTALLTATIALAATPAPPAAVDTNPEKAAWEALMSPDGEYAAIAAYTAVIQKFGQVEPYVSILRAERNHAAALTRQLQRYGVTVPANPYLGKVPAPASLKATAADEAQAEVRNVALYDRLFALETGDAQLTRVFQNLRAASQQMHLPLFQKAAAGNGTLSAAEMTAFHNQNAGQMGQAGQGYGAQAGNRGQGQMQGNQAQRGQMQGNQAQGNQAQPGYAQAGGRAQGRAAQNRNAQNRAQTWNTQDCPMGYDQPQGQRQNMGPGHGRGMGGGGRR